MAFKTITCWCKNSASVLEPLDGKSWDTKSCCYTICCVPMFRCYGRCIQIYVAEVFRSTDSSIPSTNWVQWTFRDIHHFKLVSGTRGRYYGLCVYWKNRATVAMPLWTYFSWTKLLDQNSYPSGEKSFLLDMEYNHSNRMAPLPSFFFWTPVGSWHYTEKEEAPTKEKKNKIQLVHFLFSLIPSLEFRTLPIILREDFIRETRVHVILGRERSGPSLLVWQKQRHWEMLLIIWNIRKVSLSHGTLPQKGKPGMSSPKANSANGILSFVHSIFMKDWLL